MSKLFNPTSNEIQSKNLLRMNTKSLSNCKRLIILIKIYSCVIFVLLADVSLLVRDDHKLGARIFSSQAGPHLLSEPLHLPALDSHPFNLTSQGQVFHLHSLNFVHCLLLVVTFFCLADLSGSNIGLIFFCILFGTATLLLEGLVGLD